MGLTLEIFMLTDEFRVSIAHIRLHITLQSDETSLWRTFLVSRCTDPGKGTQYKSPCVCAAPGACFGSNFRTGSPKMSENSLISAQRGKKFADFGEFEA